MLSAVQRDSRAYQFASQRLKEDADIACLTYGEVFASVTQALRSERDFCLKAVKTSPWNFESISDEMKDDIDVVIAAYDAMDQDNYFEIQDYLSPHLLDCLEKNVPVRRALEIEKKRREMNSLGSKLPEKQARTKEKINEGKM